MTDLGRIVGGKYRVVRTIGVGGMGTVFEAQHIVTERRVALKMLHAERIQRSANATKRFMKEARAAASIGHPGIVDVLDAGVEADGSLYLVLELLEGLDLENAIIRRTISPVEAVAICKEVCAPLAAAHAQGMIHRDIKPPNIFIAHGRNRRAIKLLDFGIVKQRDEQITMHGSLVGTMEYMSPEQAVGAQVDPRCDIWGLGATLFFCLTGRPPFLLKTPVDLLKAIAEQDAPRIRDVAPEVQPDLAEVVDRCLARDRDQRWPSVIDLEAALGRCLDTAAATPKPLPVRTIASLGVAVLALGLASIIAWYPREEAAKPEPIRIPVERPSEVAPLTREEPPKAPDPVEPIVRAEAPQKRATKKVERNGGGGARSDKKDGRSAEEPMRGYR